MKWSVMAGEDFREIKNQQLWSCWGRGSLLMIQNMGLNRNNER